MYPFFRLAGFGLVAWAGSPLKPLEESRVPMRVWPNDLDANFHLNNGRYLTLMDLGRWDLAIRQGLVRLLLRHKWRPLVGAIQIRYLRPLGPFRRFEMVSRLMGWDDKWFVMEQRFERDGELYARALVRLVFKSSRGTVPPAKVGEALGHAGPSPELEPAAAQWLEPRPHQTPQ